MSRQFYENLCIKDLSNNISENEKKLLIIWLDTSNENKKMYEELKNVWLSAKQNDLELNINLDEDWEKISENISAKTNNNTGAKSAITDFISSLFAPKLRPALAIGAALVIVVSSVLFIKNSETENILKTVSTKNGQRLELRLSDGSLVKLNSDSEIQYDENFSGDTREIKLIGEAFFSVKKDGRPFIIHTDNAVTKVLGTKFDVWSRESETRVIVKEGKVSLEENVDSTKKVFLTKGELSKIIEKNAPTKPSKVDADFMLGWLEGKLAFESTPLSEIARDLERYYDVKVNIENKEISNLKLTGSFENSRIDSVLAKICLALNVKYTESNGSYYIKN